MRSLPQPARAAVKACVASVAALALVYGGGAVSVSAAPAPPVTGFNSTNAGPVKYQRYAPTEASRAAQVNAPLTQNEADRLARIFGFAKDKAFTKKQYAAYLAGKGKPAGFTQAEANKAAELTRKSVTYLTNTTGNTYTRIIDGEKVTVNLGSYGPVVPRLLRLLACAPDQLGARAGCDLRLPRPGEGAAARCAVRLHGCMDAQ